MYNQKLIRTLKDRFDKLQAYLFRSFDGEEDLYSSIASIMYNKDYEDCCEWKNGEPNPRGKELRDRVKQFLIPIVAECGGISESEEDEISDCSDDRTEQGSVNDPDINALKERQASEWIIKPKENSQSAILICNECKHFIPITIDNNFCPNCGANSSR